MSELKTILIVDDTPGNLSVASGMLRDIYKVKVSKSGKKAIIISQKEPHSDLILLDTMMPEMDAWEVCRELKLNKKQSLPLLFLCLLKMQLMIKNRKNFRGYRRSLQAPRPIFYLYNYRKTSKKTI